MEVEEERAGGVDTASSINPQTLLLLVGVVAMIILLVVLWIFSGQILNALESAVTSITETLTGVTEQVLSVGNSVVQQVLKNTSSIVNQVVNVATQLEQELEPIVDMITKTAKQLLGAIALAFQNLINQLISLGNTISGILSDTITTLSAAIGTAISNTLGFIQSIFSPFFQ